jgi:tetratricopeptide (TPR) repeat protein
MGAALIGAERFHEAISMFQKSLRLSPIPHGFGVLAMLGAAYLYTKQYEAAIETYKRLLALYPNNIASHAMLARTYQTLGRDAEARAEAAEVLKNVPDFSAERFIRADITTNKQLVDETIESLRKAGLQ